MPTIKDVAKLAGVSHGTVSNIINGLKSVNSSTVKRVELAMKELGYQPDAKARSLRSSKTNSIGVVLPNIVDTIYARLYTGVEKIAREHGYSLSLYTTNDSRETEEQALNRIQQQRMDGAVVVTCIPEQTERFEQLMRAGVKLMFVRRRPAELFGTAFAGIDEKQAVSNAAATLLQAGLRDIALLTGNQTYSNERECADGFRGAMHAAGVPVNKYAVRTTQAGKENAFRAAAWWMQSSNVPQAILTTCPEFAAGVLAAVQMFKGIISPIVLALDNESWTHSVIPAQLTRIPQNYTLLGEMAAQKLLALIQEQGGFEEALILPCAQQPLLSGEKKPVFAGVKKTKCLRIAMMESAASYASSIISPVFTRQTGIEVEIDVFPYNEIYAQTVGGADVYDVMQVNVSWLNEAVQKKLLLNLGEQQSVRDAARSFSEDVLQQYGLCGGQLYALPYMFDAQMLFYRKDLFQDLRFQRMYYEKHKLVLRVPRTWEEYDRTAAFFTQEYNEEAPTQYGTTLGGSPLYGVYGFVPRIWAAGGAIFDAAGNVALNNARVIRALEEYAKAFSCADPAAVNWGWAEQTTQFCQGKAAMMAIYQAHFTDHLNRYESKIDGKIGFASLPGNLSIRGGWSLAVSRASHLPEEALCFLNWICGGGEAIPYNILGGSMPSQNVFESIEIAEIYPWLSQAHLGMKNSSGMMEHSRGTLTQLQFEVLAGKAIHACILGNCSAEEALRQIEAGLLFGGQSTG